MSCLYFKRKINSAELIIYYSYNVFFIFLFYNNYNNNYCIYMSII